jgi:hypothetical protein
MGLLLGALKWLLTFPFAASLSIQPFNNSFSIPKTLAVPRMTRSSKLSHSGLEARANDLMEAWPILDFDTKPLLRTIHICYASEEAEALVRQPLDEAMHLWIDALGGPAGPLLQDSERTKQGHNIDLKETEICRLWNKDKTAWILNPDVQSEILVVMLDELNSATMGFIPGRKHTLRIKKSVATSSTGHFIVAHEVRNPKVARYVKLH